MKLSTIDTYSAKHQFSWRMFTILAMWCVMCHKRGHTSIWSMCAMKHWKSVDHAWNQWLFKVFVLYHSHRRQVIGDKCQHHLHMKPKNRKNRYIDSWMTFAIAQVWGMAQMCEYEHQWSRMFKSSICMYLYVFELSRIYEQASWIFSQSCEQGNPWSRCTLRSFLWYHRNQIWGIVWLSRHRDTFERKTHLYFVWMDSHVPDM